MANGGDVAPDQPGFAGALTEVVRGLRGQPALLFGIGAGILLVAVLAATTRLVLVIVVAAVLLAALAAWLIRETRTRQEQRAAARANVSRATIGHSDVALIDTAGEAGASVEVEAQDAEIEGSRVGVVRTGSRARRRKRG